MPDSMRAGDSKNLERLQILLAERDAEICRLQRVIAQTSIDAIHSANEATRQDSESRFRMLAEAMPQIVWSTRPDGAVEYFNSKWEEYTGCSRQVEDGWEWMEAIHPDDIGPTIAAWKEALLSGKNYQIEHRLRRADGVYRWQLARGLPLRDDQGMILRWLGTCTDIHENKLAEAAAQCASEAKSRFLAAASHDLRQPLHAVRLFLDVLAHSIDDPQRQGIVEKAIQALEAGQDLLNALLDISTLEAGTIQIAPEVFPLGNLLGRLADEFLPQAATAGLALRHVPSSAVLRSDPVLLNRILRNLLSNAIRYTRRGRILIGCRRAGATVRIEIWDTGIGIPADKITAIFEDFYQIGNDRRDRTCGLGLGLSTVERMARLLGYEIGVHSQPDKGSVFWVTAPLAPPGDRQPTIL